MPSLNPVYGGCVVKDYRYTCDVPGCRRRLKSLAGKTQHYNAMHRRPAPANISDDDPMDVDMPDNNEGDFLRDTTTQTTGENNNTTKGLKREYHPYLTGAPCDAQGKALPPNTPPIPRLQPENPATPFASPEDFELAEFLFTEAELSESKIDKLLGLWAQKVENEGSSAPFKDAKHLYEMIDSITHGDAPWKTMHVGYNGSTSSNSPIWQRERYEVHYCDPDRVIANMLDNPDFDGLIDYQPYKEFSSKGRRYSEFMSGLKCWQQASTIYNDDPSTQDAMYCGIILGSDKTVVSVMTGGVEYHPLYLMIANIHNSAKRAHRNAVVPIGFLAIPKGTARDEDTDGFRTFKKQIYHATLEAILEPLKSGMVTPVIRRCPDGHFRRVIYDLVGYIADYPEQVLVSGIISGWDSKCYVLWNEIGNKVELPRTRDDFIHLKMSGLSKTTLHEKYGIDADIIPFTFMFPRADIYQMILPDILHQLVKGCFKDHLMTWLEDYLKLYNSAAEAKKLLTDIDRRLATMPEFPALRKFPNGRNFKQWTGSHSKALMKIIIPVLVGRVPDEIIKPFVEFIDCCYLIRRHHFDEKTLENLQYTIDAFFRDVRIFETLGVVTNGFKLPRQHALRHYVTMIEDFGSPSGHDTSITESRHKSAVKHPYKRSNRHKAAKQMARTNQRLDKLAALRTRLEAARKIARKHDRAPLPGFCQDENEEDGEGAIDREPQRDNERGYGQAILAKTPQPGYGSKLEKLARHPSVRCPDLPELVKGFLFDHYHKCSVLDLTVNDDHNTLPKTEDIENLQVFHSAAVYFYSPSDESGIYGMRREYVRCTPEWRGAGPRRDCVLINMDDSLSGFDAMDVGRLKLFFSFNYKGIYYPCALLEWFEKISQYPHPLTNLWRVKPEKGRNGRRVMTVVHIDTIIRAIHLNPDFGRDYIPSHISFQDALDAFNGYYVNVYGDEHLFELLYR